MFNSFHCDNLDCSMYSLQNMQTITFKCTYYCKCDVAVGEVIDIIQIYSNDVQ
jgi:hypothetical protein